MALLFDLLVIQLTIIYKQYNLYEVKDQFSGKPLFEVREQKFTIDPTKDFDDITNF